MFPFRDEVIDDSGLDNKKMGKEIRCNEVSSSCNDIVADDDSSKDLFDLENFDPALFCPDIIMELDDTPIFISNGNVTSSNKFKEPFLGFPKHEIKNEDVNAIFNIMEKENEARKKTFGPDNPVQYTKVHCTACNDHLGSALIDHSNRCVHPLLKVLICKECYEFYISGEFEKDDDGTEIFCRWCGQGGSVICCGKCDFVFCTTCIRINLGRNKLTEIKSNDEWKCFSCDPLQIIKLRSHCAEFMDYVRKEISRIAKLANAQSLTRTDYSKCCSEVEPAPAVDEKKKKRRSSSVDPNYDPCDKKNSRGKNALPAASKMIVERRLPTLAPKPAVKTDKEIAHASNVQSLGFTVPVQPQPQPVSNSAVDSSVSSANVYVTPLNINQIGILPQGRRIIITKNETQKIPVHGIFQKMPVAPDQSRDIHDKKTAYGKTIKSAYKVNSDLASNLTKMRGEKTTKSMKGMVDTHNKLQDILNKSIHSLVQIQKELNGCKPGNKNRKFVQTGQATSDIPGYPILNDYGSINSRTFDLQNIKISNKNNNKENKVVSIKNSR